MSNETEASFQTLDRSADTIDSKLRKEPEMDIQENEPSASELTLRSVDEWIKQATDPILRRVEEICVLLVSRTELKSTGNSEASGSRLDNTSTSPSGNRHGTLSYG